MSVVLVTGSSTGIGLATALHFGRLGDAVYAGVRDIASATELTTAIEAEKLPVHPITLETGRPMPDAEYLDLMAPALRLHMVVRADMGGMS